jgi:hypothetical protein
LALHVSVARIRPSVCAKGRFTFTAKLRVNSVQLMLRSRDEISMDIR